MVDDQTLIDQDGVRRLTLEEKSKADRVQGRIVRVCPRAAPLHLRANAQTVAEVELAWVVVSARSHEDHIKHPVPSSVAPFLVKLSHEAIGCGHEPFLPPPRRRTAGRFGLIVSGEIGLGQ